MNQFFIAISFVLLAYPSFAQSKVVVLEIEHRVGVDTCITGVEGVNNLGNPFKLGRLEYYMDEIILVHDGGSVDSSETLALVNGFSKTTLALGTFTIDSLESIRFAIGVNPSLNHLDPTTYTSNHPLAPKSPSMHWGWTAGYRFIAAEGYAGSGLSNIFEFHGLGDGNYAHLTLPTSGQLIASDTLVISITADYNELFRGLNVGSGLISHGETGAAAKVVHNINNHVFSSSEGNAALSILDPAATSLVYPNPSNGSFVIESHLGGIYEIIDGLGRRVIKGRLSPGQNRVDLRSTGMFLVRITPLTGNTVIHKIYVK